SGARARPRSRRRQACPGPVTPFAEVPMRSQLRIYLIGMLLLNAPAAIAGSRPSELASESTSISALAPPQVRGYLQVRETLSSRVGAAATLNRARVGVEGPLPASFSYKLQLEAQSHVAGS